MKTKPLLTWALFLFLILLWGFNAVVFEDKKLKITFSWDFKDTFFGVNIEFASITVSMWCLSMVLMLYYLKYQVSVIYTLNSFPGPHVYLIFTQKTNYALLKNSQYILELV